MSETDWGAFQRWWIDTYCQDGAYRKMDDVAWAAWQAGASASSSPAPAAGPVPIDMLLYCPSCGKQHIDEPDHPYYVGKTTAEGFTPRWDNPPHRSHLCHGCGCIWRPADVPTNGVADIKTEGKADTWTRAASSAAQVPEDAAVSFESLAQCIDQQVKRHKGIRALARSAGVDAGYVSRLLSGERIRPSDETLYALGIEKLVHFRVADLPKAAAAPAAGGEHG